MYIYYTYIYIFIYYIEIGIIYHTIMHTKVKKIKYMSKIVNFKKLLTKNMGVLKGNIEGLGVQMTTERPAG